MYASISIGYYEPTLCNLSREQTGGFAHAAVKGVPPSAAGNGPNAPTIAPMHISFNSLITTVLPELLSPPPPDIDLGTPTYNFQTSRLSRYYCAWYGVNYNHYVASLPFGLVLNCSDGTSLDELRSMDATRRAGIPAPKVISYGEHPETPWAPMSILMTRIAGYELSEVYDDLEETERESIVSELKIILETMRSWPNPWMGGFAAFLGDPLAASESPTTVSIPTGQNVTFNEFPSVRRHRTLSAHRKSPSTVATAKRMQDIPHPTVFTHGDFAMHNVLVHDGRVSGFID
ncbi:hypothetical protein DL770_000248 [Monosporascus sp. CRB-9-2]|nr:hypothetical protein DL770_000248 [Monosporascus sp. CRB-9-2]